MGLDDDHRDNFVYNNYIILYILYIVNLSIFFPFFLAFPPYTFVCNSRRQPQHIQNPDTLPESESNVMQSYTDIPAVPMNTDSSLGKVKTVVIVSMTHELLQ